MSGWYWSFAYDKHRLRSQAGKLFQLHTEIAHLYRENERLRAALVIYANRDDWSPIMDDRPAQWYEWIGDAPGRPWHMAQQALATEEG